MRELYDLFIVFHSTTFSHLHTSHITIISFPGIPHLQLQPVKLQAKNTWERGYEMSNVGVSNRWTGIWNGMMECKKEWNSEHTQLQLILVAGAAKSRLNY